VPLIKPGLGQPIHHDLNSHADPEPTRGGYDESTHRIGLTFTYERLIHYERPLDLPLHPDDKAWAEGIARAALVR